MTIARGALLYGSCAQGSDVGVEEEEEERASREQQMVRSPCAIQGGGMGNVSLHGQGLPWQGF